MTTVAVAPPTVRRRAALRPPPVHRFDTPAGQHLLVVDRSRIYDLDAELAELFDRIAGDAVAEQRLLDEHLEFAAPVDLSPPSEPPLRALSLNVSQACNLACSYCYAGGGSFGSEDRLMTPATAHRSVDLLLEACDPGERASIAFMGGEPLLARRLIREVAERAVGKAVARGIELRFAVTTNGTLLRADDLAFFAEHRFAVTVSVDGDRDFHDSQRVTRGGAGTFDEIVDRVSAAGVADVDLSARVTVTKQNLDLVRIVDALSAVGFRTIGCSPMLAGDPGLALDEVDLIEYLRQVEILAQQVVEAARQGRRHPFASVTTAVDELHRGTHRPYPCGAGGSYLNVSSSGDLFACHRFSEDETAAFGDLDSGIDRARQRRWLEERHVDAQTPCSGCWARYLCGGGCHHEVLNAGRHACDFVRGSLDVALRTYVAITSAAPLPLDR